MMILSYLWQGGGLIDPEQPWSFCGERSTVGHILGVKLRQMSCCIRQGKLQSPAASRTALCRMFLLSRECEWPTRHKGSTSWGG